MPLDALATSEIFNYDLHRRKNYPYVYYCATCNRSYITKEREDACKFCLNPALKLVTGGKRYIYFCENCDMRIESDEPKMACSTCGKRIMTLYRWDMLDTQEKRRIKFARLLKSFSSMMPKLEIKHENGKDNPVPIAAAEKYFEEGGSSISQKPKDPLPEEPAKGEELPSDQIK